MFVTSNSGLGDRTKPAVNMSWKETKMEAVELTLRCMQYVFFNSMDYEKKGLFIVTNVIVFKCIVW